MNFSQTQILIAAGAGVLLLLIFFDYLMWLNNQLLVLSCSEDRDLLSGISNSISLNPLRDRSSERAASKFIRSMRDGDCVQQLADWEKDYRKKYAKFICESETRHPLVGWDLVEWEDAPPLRILHYKGTRLDAPGEKDTYQELLSVTLDHRSGDWVVTKYDAMY